MSKKKSKKYKTIPEIVSTSDLQRRSGRIISAVKDAGEPYLVVRNNKPQAVILSVDEYERMKKRQAAYDWAETLEAVEKGEEEIKKGTTKKLTGSMSELWKEVQDNED